MRRFLDGQSRHGTALAATESRLSSAPLSSLASARPHHIQCFALVHRVIETRLMRMNRSLPLSSSLESEGQHAPPIHLPYRGRTALTCRSCFPGKHWLTLQLRVTTQRALQQTRPARLRRDETHPALTSSAEQAGRNPPEPPTLLEAAAGRQRLAGPVPSVRMECFVHQMQPPEASLTRRVRRPSATAGLASPRGAPATCNVVPGLFGKLV